MASAESLLNIPIDIKDLFLPFAPKDWRWSYRSSLLGSGTQIHIAPNSFYQNEFQAHNKDIASLSVFYNKTQLDGSSMLNSLPCIKVREYMQEARLNLLFNLFQNIGTYINGQTNQNSLDILASFNAKENFLRVTKFFSNFFSSSGITQFVDTTFGSALNDINVKGGSDQDETNYVLKIPYALYYRLITTLTTNFYEFPYNGLIMYDTSGGGYHKWAHSPNKLGGFIGSIVNYFAQEVRVNTTPTWNGPEDKPVTVKIDFSLYNDSLEAAVNNYMLITALIANNSWIQYHIFLHSPSLYDIQIDGVNRLFMCQGDFTVTQKGVLRVPSSEFVDKLNSYANNGYSGFENSSDLETRANEARIPDVYEVSLTFTSLLPNNFNNFIYRFYIDNEIDTISYEEGKIDTIIANAGTAIKDQWNNASLQTALDNVSKYSDELEQKTAKKESLELEVLSGVLSAQTELEKIDSKITELYIGIDRNSSIEASLTKK